MLTFNQNVQAIVSLGPGQGHTHEEGGRKPQIITQPHLSGTRLGLVLPSEAQITRLSYRLQERRFGPCPREPTKQENHCLDT